MKIKTYVKLQLLKLIMLNLIMGLAIALAVYNIDLYNKAPVTKGVVEKLGTNWTGGTWTCTVGYTWKEVEYHSEVWYHLSIDVNDDFMVHIDEDNPGKPYTTMWWMFTIIAAGFFFILNIVVSVIKIHNVKRGRAAC